MGDIQGTGWIGQGGEPAAPGLIGVHAVILVQVEVIPAMAGCTLAEKCHQSLCVAERDPFKDPLVMTSNFPGHSTGDLTSGCPNLITFFTDQQRPDSIGCYGQALPTTPVLDRLAEQGVRFSSAFTPNPVCGPARASLQTGCYPTKTGNVVNNIHLPEDAVTVAKLLAASGYATGYCGKWHLASTGNCGPDCHRTTAVPPVRRGGFADWWLAADALEWTSHGYGGYVFDGDGKRIDLPVDRYRADALTDHFIAAIHRFAQARLHGDGRPFHLMASYLEPHHQNDRNTYEPPHGWADRFAGATVPGDLAAFPHGNWGREYANYLACCRSLDNNLGRVVATLEELGILDQTVIVFASDHGCHFATRNSEYKRSCHDASIRIPLVLRGPGFASGAEVDGLASLLDVPATLLRAADVAVPADWHGRPLQDLCAGVADWRDAHLSQISESQTGRTLRTARWTYSVRDPAAAKMAAHGVRYVEDFLYDNVTDPDQLNNRILDPTLEVERAWLRQRLLKAMDAAGEPTARIDPTEISLDSNAGLHQHGAAGGLSHGSALP